MNALLLTAPSTLELVDFPTPQLQADDVLVRIRACGICGSDIHGWDGSTGRRRTPLIMGHEAAGEIAAVGPGVASWQTGDRVTFDSTVYCQKCHYCLSGYINLCENRRVLGVSTGAYRQHGAMAEYVRVPYWIVVHMPEGMSFAHAAMIEPVSIGVHAANRTPITLNNSVLVVGVSPAEYKQHGAFAEFVAVPARILYRLPANLAYEHAAMIEPVSIALHAVGRVKVAPTDVAVVVGTGMIGLFLVQALRWAGAARIVAVDLEPTRLALARELGATDTLQSNACDVPAALARLTGGRGADLAFEAVGVTPTVQLALDLVRRGGAVVLVGNLAPMVQFPLQTVVTRELTVHGTCGSAGEYPLGIDLIARGVIRVAPLISALAPLRDGAAWFRKLSAPGGGAFLKVILQP